MSASPGTQRKAGGRSGAGRLGEPGRQSAQQETPAGLSLRAVSAQGVLGRQRQPAAQEESTGQPAEVRAKAGGTGGASVQEGEGSREPGEVKVGGVVVAQGGPQGLLS